MADRSFGRNMDRIGLGVLDPALDRPRARQRAAQARIGRHRHRGEAVRGEKDNFDAEPAGARRQRRQRAHHAIDLRMPGIGCHENAHQG